MPDDPFNDDAHSLSCGEARSNCKPVSAIIDTLHVPRFRRLWSRSVVERLPCLLPLLTRKQCAVTYLYAQSEGSTLRLQVHFQSTGVAAAHVTHLLGKLHNISCLTVNDTCP